MWRNLSAVKEKLDLQKGLAGFAVSQSLRIGETLNAIDCKEMTCRSPGFELSDIWSTINVFLVIFYF